MELPSLIEKLAQVISSGTGVPATGRVLVEREKLTELVSLIRVAIPADIQEAQDLLHMRENLINQALQEARRVRNAAEEDARDRVAESEITKDAHKQSEAIIEEAQRKAQRILDQTDVEADARRAGADQYAQATLQKLQTELTQVIETIRNGIQVMDAQQESTT